MPTGRLAKSPTAVQTVGDEHEIPNRPVLIEPDGVAMGWIVHACPSQRSDLGALVRLPLPTPTQAATDAHDTWAVKIGAGRIRHV